MTTGSVAIASPAQNQGAPSAAGLIIGTPSPNAKSLTGIQPVGNSSDYSSSFGGFISGLEKDVVGAVTGIGNKIKYKGDVVLGTISKEYYTAYAAAAGAVANTAQGAQNVAKKITSVSSLLVFAVIAFLAFPYIMALRKK